MFWQYWQTKFRNSNILNFQNITRYINLNFMLVNYTWNHTIFFCHCTDIPSVVPVPGGEWIVESSLWISTTDNHMETWTIHIEYCMCWAGKEESIQKRFVNIILIKNMRYFNFNYNYLKYELQIDQNIIFLVLYYFSSRY